MIANRAAAREGFEPPSAVFATPRTFDGPEPSRLSRRR